MVVKISKIFLLLCLCSGIVFIYLSFHLFFVSKQTAVFPAIVAIVFTFIWGGVFFNLPIVDLREREIMYRTNIFDVNLKSISIECIKYVSVEIRSTGKNVSDILCLHTSDRGIIEINTMFCTESALTIKTEIMKMSNLFRNIE